MAATETVAEHAARGSHMRRGMRLGPYEIAGFIGAGAMGEVYRAHDTNLDRPVALKLLPEELAADRDLLRRFEQEARAASALSHPAIVTIYEAGQIGSQPYISMELVAGQTLREILGVGALPLRRALRIAEQVADGLAKAHAAGFVHRDLKPENIKVSVDGFAKILDFGLAKRVAGDADAESGINTRTAVNTQPGIVMGTVGYMSPEQAAGEHADCQSDQFSFGAILFEMLTGRRAFERPTAAETLSAIIQAEPPAIAQLNPAVPPPVRWIVERCLAKHTADRYRSTQDLARDLASASEHLSELMTLARVRVSRRGGGDSSIAVLPVVNLSGDARQEPLADAMTDALITELTALPGLRVISRISSMAYKGRRNALPEIAEELGVEWIVLASSAKVDGRVRISAQLVDASSDENRWAKSYTRPARNILALQTDVSAAIARDVKNAVAERTHTSSA